MINYGVSFAENLFHMKTFTIILFGLFSIIINPNHENQERKKVLDKVFLLLEENIANPNWLENQSFLDFKKPKHLHALSL